MIKLNNVSKIFATGTSALQDVNLAIDKGEFVFLTGRSGSGKTTLLRLLIRDLTPSSGSIIINDWEITKLPQSKVPHLRRKIGVVFQDLKLLMDRTIFENISLPLEMSNTDPKTIKQKIEEVMEQVGILEHRDKFPIQLSGGELQRTAIARALIFAPDVLLADEPTGNLDMATSWEIIKLLEQINSQGTTVIMATHNNDIVESLKKREVVLEKGRITKDHNSKKSHHPEAKTLSEKEEVENAGEKKGENK